MMRYALMAALTITALGCAVATEPDTGSKQAEQSLDNDAQPRAEQKSDESIELPPFEVENLKPILVEPNKPTPDPWYVLPTKPTPDPWAPDDGNSEKDEDTTDTSTDTSRRQAQSAAMDPNVQ